MEAPDTFHPVNILKATRGFPPPIRLGYTKSELYGDLAHLKSADEHAVQVRIYKRIYLNTSLPHNNAFWRLLKYHVFKNIIENGAFALLEQMHHFP